MSLLERLEAIHAYVLQAKGILKTNLVVLRRRGVMLPPHLYDTLENIDKELNGLVIDLQKSDENHNRYKHALKLIDFVSEDVPQTYQSILEFLCEMMNAETGVIVAHNPHTHSWERCYGYNDGWFFLDQSKMKENLFKYLATLDKVMLSDNMQFRSLPANRVPRLHSFLLLPIIVDDVRICSVCLDNPIKQGVFRSHDVELIEHVAPIIGQVMMLSQCLADNKKE